MDKIKRLTLEVRLNRIIIGSMLVLFSISTNISPLGSIALVPLLGAILVLSGILNWKSIPELIEILGLRTYKPKSQRGKNVLHGSKLAKMN